MGLCHRLRAEIKRGGREAITWSIPDEGGIGLADAVESAQVVLVKCRGVYLKSA